MIFLSDPSYHGNTGKQLSVPPALKNEVANWAAVQFMKHPFGYILTQELITKMFSIYIYRFMIEESIVLYPYSAVPILTFQFMLLGSLPYLLRGFGKLWLREGRYNLFYLPAGISEAVFEKGEYEALHVELNNSFVRELPVSHKDIRALADKLKRADQTAQALLQGIITKEIRSVLDNLRSYTKEGSALNLALSSDIYKLLSIYESYLSDAEERHYLLLPGTAKILSEIRGYIVSDPDIHECSAENLSGKFRININTLKINFRNEFHVTLHQFVLNEVMQKARLMVLGSKYSISSIAIQLGYSDKSNFAKAFKQYFGILPSEMRKRQE